MRNFRTPLALTLIALIAALLTGCRAEGAMLRFPPADPPKIVIQHRDGSVTELRCRTGSGVIACRHQDLYLYLTITFPKQR